MKDPIVEEIHKVREELLKKFNGDKEALFRYFKEAQEEERKKGRRIVSLPRKTTKK